MESNNHAAPYRGTFANRQDAGRRLARALARYKDQHPVVLALLRGGVPVGFEIAKALEAPLDVLLVRMLRAPESPGLELGAIVDALHPECILNESVIESLQISPDYINSEARVQLQIIEEHKRRFRGYRPPLPLAERTVIVADEGIANVNTIRAAIKALALAEAASTVLAVPVAPHEVVQSLASEADDMVCLLFPADFRSIGFYYADSTPPTDDEVIALLRKGSSAVAGSVPSNAKRWGM